MKKFSLSKREKLTKRNDFNEIYNSGSVIFSKNNKIKCVFLLKKTEDTVTIKAAFAAGRKAGNAVWRNRVKRLLREAYRLNKHLLHNNLPENTALHLVLSPSKLNMQKNKNLYLIDIYDEVIEILTFISVRLSRFAAD